MTWGLWKVGPIYYYYYCQKRVLRNIKFYKATRLSQSLSNVFNMKCHFGVRFGTNTSKAAFLPKALNTFSPWNVFKTVIVIQIYTHCKYEQFSCIISTVVSKRLDKKVTWG